MRVNMGAPILGIRNQELFEDDDKGERRKMTLGSVAATALLAKYNDEKIDQKEGLERFLLASICITETEQDITVQQAALIQQLIHKLFPPLVLGRVNAIIEPPSAPKATEATEV